MVFFDSSKYGQSGLWQTKTKTKTKTYKAPDPEKEKEPEEKPRGKLYVIKPGTAKNE